MKKKLMAILLTAVMVMSMASSAFAATDENEIPGVVGAQLEQTVNWSANNLYDDYSQDFYSTKPEEAISDRMYNYAFLIAVSGVKSDTVTNFNSIYTQRIKENLASNNGKLNFYSGSGEYRTKKEADPIVYAGTISYLTAAGENPASFNGYNLLEAFQNALSTQWGQYVSYSSPYDLNHVIAVLNKYNGNITNASTWISSVMASFDYYYVEGEYVEDVYVTDTSASEVFNNGAADITGDQSIEGKYSKDSYGYYQVPVAANEQAVIDALTPKIKTTSGCTDVVVMNKYLVVKQTKQGTGINYYGFKSDNDSKGIELYSQTTGSGQKITTLINKLLTYKLEDGTYYCDQYIASNADSTGLALAAFSDAGSVANAKNTYVALKKFLNSENGAAQLNGKDDRMATMDALEGLASYYRALVGESGIWMLNNIELFKGADKEKYDIVKTGDAGEKLTYKPGSGQGFSVKSNADVTKFLAALIDGKVVPMEHVKLEKGSTIVTIDSEYMDALDAGAHTITIQSTDGFATASFTVTGGAPNTGDANMVLLFASLAIISGMGLAVYGKKRYMR